MSAPGSASSPEALYPTLAPALQRIVARNVTAPRATTEEACQIAWSRWAAARAGIAPEATLGWLCTTATREALRMARRQARELSLDAPGADEQVRALPSPSPAPDEAVLLRERLAEIHRLPARQQRLIWLRGLGYGYAEIADRTGESLRTVERQLLRAGRTLRESA